MIFSTGNNEDIKRELVTLANILKGNNNTIYAHVGEGLALEFKVKNNHPRVKWPERIKLKKKSIPKCKSIDFKK
jgi:hypothetical protein